MSYIFIVLNIFILCNCEVNAIFEKDFDTTNYKYSNDSSNIPSSDINSEISNIKLVFKK